MRYVVIFFFLNSFAFFEVKALDGDPKIKTSARILETQFIFDKLTSEKTDLPGWNLRDGFPETYNSENQFLNRNTTSFLTAGFIYNKSSTEMRLVCDLDFVRRGEREKQTFYAGKNTYVSMNLNHWWIGVGRREFLFRKSPFSGYTDGGEGAFLERSFTNNLIFQIFLLDHYKGYRLLEKEFLNPGLLMDESLLSKSGQRRRHSLGLLYEKEIQISFGLSYLEFGALGKQAQEIPSSVKKYGADGDSLLMGNVGSKYTLGGIYMNMELLWAKGVDKSNSRGIGISGSIPIEGEAISIGFGYKDEEIFASFALHANDSDQRNQENKLTKIGYVNTGTHLGSTYFISQYLQLFPSGQFTDSGMERSQTLLSGRTPASYAEVSAGVNFFQISLKLISAYFLPYIASGKSDGHISLRKERYERFFLTETGFELAYNTKIAVIGVSVSYLSSSFDLALHGTIISCFGKVQF